MKTPDANADDAPQHQRFRLTLAYDGAPWCGWQSQPTGNAVQDQLERAFATVFQQPIRVHGSGRTDAGVHALAQIAHCDVPSPKNVNLIRAINALLPPSIRLLNAEPAAPSFHARFDAIGKVYRYRLHRSEVLSPFDQGRAWHLFGDLDLGSARLALSLLQGTHNFTRFSALRGEIDRQRRLADPRVTVRTITRAELTEQGEQLHIEFEGNGFLYKMVRLMVGSVIQVARGRMSLDHYAALLSQLDGPTSHVCAPAEGLYLVRVEYP
jgi:tRNA pseudouridine38-40 synthase